MIEDVWKKMSADPAATGCCFKEIGTPSPDAASMKKCRDLCAQNLCGEYGVTWACPPGVGSDRDCLKDIKSFSKAAVIIKKYEDVDLKDRAATGKLAVEFQDTCRRFGNMLRKNGYRVLPLSDGGCKYCKKCSYPEEPCKFPDQKMASVSSYGIEMEEYMKKQNIDFKFSDDSMTLYGLILYDEP